MDKHPPLIGEDQPLRSAKQRRCVCFPPTMICMACCLLCGGFIFCGWIIQSAMAAENRSLKSENKVLTQALTETNVKLVERVRNLERRLSDTPQH
jgi:hypothetical protein